MRNLEKHRNQMVVKNFVEWDHSSVSKQDAVVLKFK